MTTIVYTSGTHSGTVSSGNEVDLEGGAVGSGLVIQSGGIVSAYGGAMTSGSVIGGLEVVGAGSTDQNSFVSGGGVQIAQVAATVSGLDVELLGSSVVSGGTVSGTLLSGGSQFVYSGMVSDTTISDDLEHNIYTDGVQTIYGGTVTGTMINDNGQQVVSGGAVSATTIGSGGEQAIFDGTVSGVTVAEGGLQLVRGGMVSATTIDDGGSENVIGGMISGSVISSGGLQYLSGGTVDATTVSAGGFQVMYAGTVSATTVDSGGVQTVFGGTTSSTMVESGGTVFVEDVGAVATNGVVEAGGTVYLVGSAAATDMTFSGGTEVVELGGSVTGPVLTGSGLADLVVSGGGSATYALATQGTQLTVSAGGQSTNGTISGNEVISSGGIAISSLVARGGTEVILSGGLASGTVVDAGGLAVLNSGGVLTVSGPGDYGVIELLSGGTLDVDGTTGPLEEISGFTGGSVIDLESFAYGTITSFTETQNSVTFTTNSGGSETLNVAGVGAYSGQLSEAANGSTLFETCFAAGTLISTPDGERLVEQIRPGELVDTLEGPRAVVWVGHRSVDVARLPDPIDHWLVRIRAGAFADAAPGRDLWVTGEHGILVDDGLVPARMLVNGGSIVRDRTRGRYTYHHLELERHGILFAEGLPTESYLDTGNRAGFANAGLAAWRPGLAIEPSHYRWATDAAAPLLVTREQVEPIWRRLAERAAAMGWMHEAASDAARTTDPALQLELANGMTLAAETWDGTQAVFKLPAGARAVRLLSRSARPSEAVGAFVDDRRWLGVAVRRLMLQWDQGATKLVLNAHHLDGAGWHDLEGEVRWTNGAAALRVPVAEAPSVIVVTVAGTMRYHLFDVAAIAASAA